MHFINLLFLLLTATVVHARPFDADWMTSPLPADSSCLWFRCTFVAGKASERPVCASVSVATASRFILYVNGRNVSTALFSNAAPSAITYDVTRFLRPDSNTVAVLACPTAMSSGASLYTSSPKISVSFFGSTAANQPFVYTSADGWMCHTASTSLTAGGELMDACADALPPAYGDMVMAQWLPVGVVPLEPQHSAAALPRLAATVVSHAISAESLFGYNPLGYNLLSDNSAYANYTLLPRYFDSDGHTVTYDFSPGFHGIVRVTLRGCRRGERIRIGDNLTYICSGEMDEQAYCRFSTQYARKVTISGDRWFSPEQVQEVVAVCVLYPCQALPTVCNGATR